MYYQDQNSGENRNILTNHSQQSSHHISSQSQFSGPQSDGNRPPSELLCDLHVYKVPSDLWRESFNNILNHVVTETISVGIIRVPTELRLVDLREEIVQQLQSEDLVPRDYVFLRSVGRSLTRLRGKQEYQLKAKHFLPPVAYAPELYILEATPEIRDALAISDRSSQSPPLSRRTSPSHRGYPPNTYRNGYPGDLDLNRTHKPGSPSNKYKPLPQIESGPDRLRDPINHHKRNYSPPDRDSNNHSPSDKDPKNDHNPSSSGPPYNQYNPEDHHNNHYKVSHNNTQNRYNDPYSYYNSSKNSYFVKHNKTPREHYSEKPGSEWDEQAEKKPSVKAYHIYPTQDSVTSLPKQSPPRSAEKGRDQRHDDDSGLAELSSQEPYKRRNREKYDNLLRRSRDVHGRVESDDETGNYRDSQRWNVDKEERRRQAEEDRRKMEEERKRVEQLEREEQRQRDEEERRKRHEEEEQKRKEKEEQRKRKEGEEKRQEEQRRREEEEESRKAEEEQRRREKEEKERKEEEQRRKEGEEQKQKEKERKRKEEEEDDRRRQEENEKIRREDREQKKKEQAALERREKEEERLRRQQEARNGIGSPNERQGSLSDPEFPRDTESARQRRRDEKNQLLKDIEEAQQARQAQEKEREELVKRAKQMQHRTTNRRNEARDMWKKKYFEEKKKTAPLEENSNRLRNELEVLHRKLMNTLEGPKDKNLRVIDYKPPSEKSNYIIQCTRMQHEIEDLQRRVENARMKLTAEMKLRNQAQGELRALRAELMQKKLSIDMSRQLHLAT